MRNIVHQKLLNLKLSSTAALYICVKDLTKASKLWKIKHYRILKLTWTSDNQNFIPADSPEQRI